MNYNQIHQWLLDLSEKSSQRGNNAFTQEVLDIITLLQDDWVNYNIMKQDRANDKAIIEALEKTMTEEGYKVETVIRVLSKPVLKNK